MRSLKRQSPASIELPNSIEKLNLSNHDAKDADVSGLRHLADDLILVEDRIENESEYDKGYNDKRIHYYKKWMERVPSIQLSTPSVSNTSVKRFLKVS